jgi:hypothetical protein
MRGSENIVPLVFDGVPLADDLTQECIPRRLRYQIDVNGIVSDVPQKPFIIDLRHNNKTMIRLARETFEDAAVETYWRYEKLRYEH